MVRTTNTKSSRKRKPVEKAQSLVFKCTSCAQPQLLIQGKRNILCHPQLQVGVCRECLIFAHADIVPIDDEGYEIFCRWCTELGNLVCCDTCKAPYCEECISRNVGVDYYESLSECEEWQCFSCDPSVIKDLRELTKSVLSHQNYNEPSDLLLEKCSSVFEGDADVNDSDREDIVKERLRLRRNTLNATQKQKKKDDREISDDEDSLPSEVDKDDKRNKAKSKGTQKRKNKKTSDEDSLPSDVDENADDNADKDNKRNKAKAKGTLMKKNKKTSDEDSLPSDVDENADKDDKLNKPKSEGTPKKKNKKTSDEDSLPSDVDENADENPDKDDKRNDAKSKGTQKRKHRKMYDKDSVPDKKDSKRHKRRKDLRKSYKETSDSEDSLPSVNAADGKANEDVDSDDFADAVGSDIKANEKTRKPREHYKCTK